jgi:branched-chain amino acid aminotransferase
MASYRWMTMLDARIDGKPRPLEQATISVADEGLLRGDGVFEVLRIYAGCPFAVEEHLDRMSRSAATLRLPFDMDAAREDIFALAAAAGDTDGLIRLIKTRGGRLIALLESAPCLPVSVRLASITYCPSGILDGVKTISYAANALATRLADERGADEALFVSPDGWVLEGPNFAAFFAFSDQDCFYTPPLEEGILDSITRRRLMGLVAIEERRIHRDELAIVREAFVASTVREVLPVSCIDDVQLPSAPGLRTVDAATRFKAHVQARTDLVNHVNT